MSKQQWVKRWPFAWSTTLLVLVVSCGSLMNPSCAQDADDWAEFQIKPPFSWNRPDRYEPPDYEAFFPNDIEGGKQLDLMIEGKRKPASIDERLALIRRGLRNTTHHCTTLLGNVGNEFVWNKEQPESRAVELLYHASVGTDTDVAHYALYHGPTVTSRRTPNLVRMLMEQYQSMDAQMQHRIAWGMKTYGDKEHTRKLLLQLLDKFEQISPEAIGATLDTYEAVFESMPPDMDRFAEVGKWVIAFHRIDVSVGHPRAERILRVLPNKLFQHRRDVLLEFVTRVDGGHETAVVLVQGMGARAELVAFLTRYVNYRIDFNEMLSPRTLQERRLREFAQYLADGLPKGAAPEYTRPPADAEYAWNAAEFIAPDFEGYFADDAAAGAALDEVYANRRSLTLTDRELLESFRRGVRRSTHTPNTMWGWISTSIRWPRDPMLTEIMYQAMDPNAPPDVRKAGNYYGFGLGTEKTRNILEAMYRIFMAPPFDRTTNGNMRSRILWGVRDHEDDKQYLATRFAQALRDHELLSDVAVEQVHNAYRQLTDDDPPNFDEYSSRGVYLVMCRDKYSRTVAESKERMAQRFGDSPQLIHSTYAEKDGTIIVKLIVRGLAGFNWSVERLQEKEPKVTIDLIILLTHELISQAQDGALDDFAEYLPKP